MSQVRPLHYTSYLSQLQPRKPLLSKRVCSCELVISGERSAVITISKTHVKIPQYKIEHRGMKMQWIVEVMFHETESTIFCVLTNVFNTNTVLRDDY